MYPWDISASVGRPHFTSTVGSGLFGLFSELSHQSVKRSVEPAGILGGSANLYVCCQLKA